MASINSSKIHRDTCHLQAPVCCLLQQKSRLRLGSRLAGLELGSPVAWLVTSDSDASCFIESVWTGRLAPDLWPEATSGRPRCTRFSALAPTHCCARVSRVHTGPTPPAPADHVRAPLVPPPSLTRIIRCAIRDLVLKHLDVIFATYI